MRMLAQSQYMSAADIRRVDTKRLAAELKPLGYSLNYITGAAAAGNNRLWLEGPASTDNDAAAVAALTAQAERVRVLLS